MATKATPSSRQAFSTAICQQQKPLGLLGRRGRAVGAAEIDAALADGADLEGAEGSLLRGAHVEQRVDRWRRAGRHCGAPLCSVLVKRSAQTIAVSQVFHSDRRTQHASKEFRDVLTGSGITASKCRRGNRWYNACSETPVGSVKMGRLHGYRSWLDVGQVNTRAQTLNLSAGFVD